MAGRLDHTFTALADPTRRAIVELLRREPRRASDLADALGASRPAMSRHLRVLRSAGLVTDRIFEGDARGRLYQLRRQPFAGLREWVEDVEAFWGEQLHAFKTHAEHPRRRRRR